MKATSRKSFLKSLKRFIAFRCGQITLTVQGTHAQGAVQVDMSIFRRESSASSSATEASPRKCEIFNSESCLLLLHNEKRLDLSQDCQCINSRDSPFIRDFPRRVWMTLADYLKRPSLLEYVY